MRGERPKTEVTGDGYGKNFGSKEGRRGDSLGYIIFCFFIGSTRGMLPHRLTCVSHSSYKLHVTAYVFLTCGGILQVHAILKVI